MAPADSEATMHFAWSRTPSINWLGEQNLWEKNWRSVEPAVAGDQSASNTAALNVHGTHGERNIRMAGPPK
jgi:hypothetical protein